MWFAAGASLRGTRLVAALAVLFAASASAGMPPLESRNRPMDPSVSDDGFNVLTPSSPPAKSSAAQGRQGGQDQPAPRAVRQNQSGRAGQQGTAGDSGDLFYTLQLLQQEVLELRGVLEEQQHQLDKMVRQSRDRYLDIDERLSRGGASGQPMPSRQSRQSTQSTQPIQSTPPGQSPQSNQRSPRSTTPDSGTPAVQPRAGVANNAELDAYNAAFALTRERRFGAAVAAFNGLIARWPDGGYAAGAHYWLGQLHQAMDPPDLEKSRTEFALFVTQYPGHAKMADALFKLGVVYDRLGDKEQAREYFGRVQREYANSSAATLARNYSTNL